MRAREAAASNEREAQLLTEISDLVHGVTMPFACGGTLVANKPVTLRFTDGVSIPIRRTDTGRDDARSGTLHDLVARCTPAPFGKGRKTLFDRSVRDARQLKADSGAFSVAGFDPVKSGVLETVRRELVPHDPNPLRAELYCLNVYSHRGHFEPHKDTPRGDDMIGTLVVCLPMRFRGGEFLVTHHGAHRVFDWARKIEEQSEADRLHWAAFFGDVDHAITEVWGGHRVTLTYLLHRGEGVSSRKPGDDSTGLLRAKLDEALADKRFLARGGVLAFPCFHMYSGEASFQKKAHGALTTTTARKLKGRDHDVAMAALDAGLTVSLQPYLVESCADQTWQLQRFPTARERDSLDDRLDSYELEEALPVQGAADSPNDFDVRWVVPPPQFNLTFKKPEAMSAEQADNPTPDRPAVQHFHGCEYSATGYFGNEGGDADFYVYAALHVEWPRWAEREGRKNVAKRDARATRRAP